jgi:hypothetical protein
MISTWIVKVNFVFTFGYVFCNLNSTVGGKLTLSALYYLCSRSIATVRSGMSPWCQRWHGPLNKMVLQWPFSLYSLLLLLKGEFCEGRCKTLQLLLKQKRAHNLNDDSSLNALSLSLSEWNSSIS